MNLDMTLREMVEAGAAAVAGVTLGQLLTGVAAYVGVRALLWVGRAVMTPDKPEPMRIDD